MATVRVRGADALAAGALTPIAETLRHMAARPEIQRPGSGTSEHRPMLDGIEPGLVVTDPTGWVRATDLASGDALDDLLGAAAQRWQAAPHAAAALAWKSYAYWLALPAIVGYATVRRVPLMAPDAVLVRWSAERPFLRVGLAATARRPVRVAVLPSDPVLLYGPGRGIRVVPHEPALLDELRTAIMDEHLAPILRHIRSRLHIGRRTLWGSLASGVAHGLSRAADVIPGSTLQAAQAVLDSFGVADLVEVGQRPDSAELTVRRRTCCLAFTLPEPHQKVCAGCCIR